MKHGNRRITAALLALSMLLGCFAFPVHAASDMVGDVDGDGYILPRDAAIVARYLAGWEGYVDASGGVACPDLSEGVFSVGYGIVNTTPDLNYYKRMPLAGYGNTDTRPASGVPDGDGLKATCVAIRDEKGETILMFSTDIINMSKNLGTQIRTGVSNATGVPIDHISSTATHTHTAPDYADTSASRGYTQRYFLELVQKAILAARRAINDLSPATLWAGDTSVTNINFVRRFLVTYSTNSSYNKYETHTLIGDDHRVGYEGPNTIDDGTVYLAHETAGDNEVQYIVFKRDGVKDVLLYNWQCHPDQVGNGCYDLNLDGSYVGKYNKSSKVNRVVSADFINGARRVLEKNDYLSAYYQGPAGNMNQSDKVDNAQNKQIGSSVYSKYRLNGWSSSYYSECYSGSNTNKGYWKSQMVGSIVADAILTDIEKTYSAYDEPVHNDTTDSNGQPLQNWTDNWEGMRELPAGEIRTTYTTYYTTRENNDRDLGVVMKHLSKVANGSITFASSYTVKYGSSSSSPTVTVGSDDLDAIRSCAETYASKTTDADRKAYAWEVLNTYRKKINDAFSDGMKANGGSSGGTNTYYCVARLLCRLATGLYVNNYYANGLNNRSGFTDLKNLTTDASKYTETVELHCFSIGQSVAFCFAPYEMFDTIGQEIKDGRYIKYGANGLPITTTKTVNGTSYQAATYKYTDDKSPFALTFVCGYTNDAQGYVPSRYARNHTESQNFQNGYETYVTRYAVGTAEEHGAEFRTMLNDLYSGNMTPRVAGHV